MTDQQPDTPDDRSTVTTDRAPSVIPSLRDGQEIVVETVDGDRLDATVQDQEVIASGGRILDPGSIDRMGIVDQRNVIERLPTQETEIGPDMVPQSWPDVPDTFTTLAPVALRRMVATIAANGIDTERAARTAAAQTMDKWYHGNIERTMIDILTAWLVDQHPGEEIDPGEVPDHWEALSPLSSLDDLESLEGA